MCRFVLPCSFYMVMRDTSQGFGHAEQMLHQLFTSVAPFVLKKEKKDSFFSFMYLCVVMRMYGCRCSELLRGCQLPESWDYQAVRSRLGVEPGNLGPQ